MTLGELRLILEEYAWKYGNDTEVWTCTNVEEGESVYRELYKEDLYLDPLDRTITINSRD